MCQAVGNLCLIPGLWIASFALKSFPKFRNYEPNLKFITMITETLRHRPAAYSQWVFSWIHLIDKSDLDFVCMASIVLLTSLKDTKQFTE